MEPTSPLFVNTLPVWQGDGPPFPTDFALPEFEFGKPITWEDGYVPPAVFIGQTKLANGAEVYLYGVRYELGRRVDLPPEAARPTGYFVSYVAVEAWAGRGPVIHVLAQWRSTTYQSGQESGDSMDASSLKKKERLGLCLTEAEPKWKASSARWPLLAGVPMLFVGQFGLPETEVTRQWLTFNEAVFFILA